MKGSLGSTPQTQGTAGVVESGGSGQQMEGGGHKEYWEVREGKRRGGYENDPSLPQRKSVSVTVTL